MARRNSRRKSSSSAHRRLPTAEGQRTNFMHPYSKTKKSISLPVDHFKRKSIQHGKREIIQAIAYDSKGRAHYKIVANKSKRKRSSGKKRKSKRRSNRRRSTKH